MLSTLRITGNNNALRRMKKGKAVGADELPVEVWKCKGKMGIRFLTRLFNRLLLGERMPEEWRRSVLIPIYKNKGDAQCCGNYRGIKLMNHTMKVWERIIEARLRAGLKAKFNTSTSMRNITACFLLIRVSRDKSNYLIIINH